MAVMKIFSLGIMLILLGCAGAEIANERLPLAKNAFTKTDLIIVKKFKADQTTFHGSSSKDEKKRNEEKGLIENELNKDIVQALNEDGYRAFLESDAMNNRAKIVIEGEVMAFDPGSAAGRFFSLGYGAGRSKLHVKVRVKNESGNAIADFNIYASSGGRGGWTGFGDFLKEHLEDAGESIAEYFNTKL